MLTNLIVYVIGGDLPEPSVLEARMGFTAFVPCGPTQPNAAGWVPARGKDHGALLEAVGGQWMAMLMLESRLLPSPVIKRRLKAKVEELEKATGRAPKGRLLKELKEEVIQELLPKAFTRQVRVPVWIDPVRKRVVIDAGSSGRAESAAMALIALEPKMNLRGLRTVRDASGAMTAWIASGEPPSVLSLDREVELRGTEEHPPVVRISQRDVDADDVRDLIRQGMMVNTLALTYRSRVSFVLTGSGTLRQVKVLDVAFLDSTPDEATGEFDASVAILTGELGLLLDDLVHELGGEAVLPIEAAAGGDAPADGSGPGPATHDGDADTDPLYQQAVTLVMAESKASISLVQRHLRIGYNRAARLLERMEAEELVTAMDRSGVRSIAAGVSA